MGRKKKQEDDADKETYVGRRVEKNFEGFGKYTGSVVAYNAARGFYKVVYDDGDREELERHELEPILVHAEDVALPSGKRGRTSKKEEAQVEEPDSKRQRREPSSEQNTPSTRRKDGGDFTRSTRQRPSVQKSRNCDQNDKDDGDAEGDALCTEEDRENGAAGWLDTKGELPTVGTSKRKRPKQDQDCASTLPPVKSTRTSARVRSVRSQNLLQAFEDASEGDDSCNYEDESDVDENDELSSSDVDSFSPVLANLPEEPNLPPLVPLPPSSKSFPLSEDLVAEAFAVYSFLRSFSHALFLSPFTFDDFVSALVAERANHLFDSIHFILLQSLRRHLQRLRKEDCVKAQECLRQLDWNLLDNVTWPSFLIVFLATQGFGKCYGQRVGSLRLLDAEYYKTSGKLKLAVLSFLCDHALDTEEIRAVMDARELECENQPGQKDIRYFNNNTTDAQEGQLAPVTEEHKMKVYDGALQETSTSSTDILNVTSKSVQEESFPDGNSDECVLCGMNGNLICCDGCPAAYHSRCVGIARASLPPGEWFCPECIVEKFGGEQSRRMRGLKGCQSLGVDPYGRTFMVTCGYLLVLSPSYSAQFNYSYYKKHDILQVIQTLEEQAPYCADVALAIRQYWHIPVEQLALSNNPQEICEATGVILSQVQSSSEQLIQQIEQAVSQESDKTVSNDHKVTSLDVPLPEKTISGANETALPMKSNVPLEVTPDDTNGLEAFELPLVVEASAGRLTGMDDVLEDETAVKTEPDLHTTSSARNLRDSTLETCQSETLDPCLDRPSRLPLKAVLIKALNGTVVSTCGEVPPFTPLPVHTQRISIQNLEQDPYLAQRIVDRDSKGRFLTSSSREHLSSDTFQKLVPQEHFHTNLFVRISSYMNHYVFGDAAATAAANLALMTGDEADRPEKGTRKLRKTGTTIAEQVNAFCKAPARFCWPSLRKKLMEAPKDRCGWCFSCTSCMKRGCLLNQAASQLAAGAARVSGGIRPGKYGCGHLPAVVGYILYMEEVLQSFLMGPWENVNFRKQWRKKLEQTSSFCDVKASLLDLEANLRSVVLVEDWSICLEDAPSMVLGRSVTSCEDDSLSKKASGKRSSRRSGASRRGLPKSGKTTLGNVQWIRRGKLAHRVAGWATLCTKVARKAARQGGIKSITGITYVDSEEVPRRSKQTAWRARVQAACTVAELAVQVRCLDSLLRWDNLLSKSEVHATSKVCEEDGNQDGTTFGVHTKSVRDNLVMYLVDSTLVPRQSLRQSASLPGLPQRCNGQVWVEERQVPLHVLKEFEEKERMARQSQAPKLILLQKYLSEARRAPKKDIFNFLWARAGFSTPTKLVMSVMCKFCGSKVLASLAVQCHLCKEPFHKECTVASHAFGTLEVKHSCCGCLKQLVQKKSTVLSSVKQEPAACLQKQGNENSQPAMNPPSHQKRFVLSQASPQPLAKLPLKLPLKASPLGSQAKKDSIPEGSQEPSIDQVSKIVEKNLSEGVYWRKNGTSSRMRFEKNLLLPIQGEHCKENPKCYVCKQHFKGDLIYIKCEYCPLWYHGDAVGVNMNTLDEVMGFKCNRCRKKAVPTCPYGTNTRMHKRVAHGSLPPCNAPLPAVSGRSSLIQEPCITKRSPLPFVRVVENQAQRQLASPGPKFSPILTAETDTVKPLIKSHPFMNGYPQKGPEKLQFTEGSTLLKPSRDGPQLESHSQPSRERFQQLMEESTPLKPLTGPTNNVSCNLPSIQPKVEEETFDQSLDVLEDIDSAVSEEGQRLSGGEETLAQDDMMEDASVNGESSAQPTLSFMELLSSEDNRVEELAEVAMDFGVDGFDVFDLDTILGNFESVEPLAQENIGQSPIENKGAAQCLDGAVGTIDELCSVCGDVSQPSDLQCVACGVAVHQNCVNVGQSGTGTWLSYGWACDACKDGILQSQDVLADRMPLGRLTNFTSVVM
ncbi:hypothetical protein GOP47_0017029 [Adiantum capillus-veneris]|uniref:Uncharacterized protein n=1 Tax=Adiantum capillus-veneris TaxID=13818 RepID=A0A9D4UIC6_ADICA|nr:hypothetical protein GOP47_0016354 [Adiantum capillus-veneris]KAI5068684.1 hypothetical protein GOP47_0017029 [Adiantum capillus-veneris]